MSVEISVIIVNYNAGFILKECVANCITQVTEVILIDNHSVDGSIDIVQKFFDGNSKLKIIRNNANLGFSVACNKGAELASCEFLLFLNPDCIARPGSIQSLADALKSDDGAGMVGGLLLNIDGSEQIGCRRSVPTPWRSFIRAFHLTIFNERWPKLFESFNEFEKPLPKKPIYLEAISGACTMIRRKDIEDVGLWDEGYFLHCEDLDLCMRYRQKKWEILFVPNAVFVHIKGACSRNIEIFVEWHKHKGMTRFYSKFFRKQYPLGLMLLVYVAVWLRFMAKSCSIILIRTVAIFKNHN